MCASASQSVLAKKSLAFTSSQAANPLPHPSRRGSVTYTCVRKRAGREVTTDTEWTGSYGDHSSNADASKYKCNLSKVYRPFVWQVDDA